MNLSIELTSTITMAICFTFWLAGLSFKINRAEKDVERLEKDHKSLGDEFRDDMKEFQNYVSTSLGKINNSLHRIEGGIWGHKKGPESDD